MLCNTEQFKAFQVKQLMHMVYYCANISVSDKILSYTALFPDAEYIM